LRYLICITAVKIRMATSKYVTGNVRALNKVYESIEATPFVDKAVYPPSRSQLMK
jgi:hypothetical protein